MIDSILPRDVAVARFRTGVPEVTALAGGAPTREALVRQFVEALERRDTAGLRELLLTRAEFAWLYYPTNPQGLPPYDLSPGLLWEMSSLNSAKGLRRALQEFGGTSLGYQGHVCDPQTSRQGANTVTGPCTVRLLHGTSDREVRLFGLIVERGGRHKFVSYANKL
ncbi:MAG: hypothetical protein Q8Q14_05850 [Gemmatimonadales bacterium]|nr:hypothetical protein [Gemmatimonadales bacterium]